MSLTDKTLKCRECGQDFVFTVGEQTFYLEKGFQNEPSRCRDCRDARKREREMGGSGQSRQMYKVICAECGTETEVPFHPRGDRPVYCRECFQNHKAM